MKFRTILVNHCGVCEKTFKTSAAFRKHLLQGHKSNNGLSHLGVVKGPPPPVSKGGSYTIDDLLKNSPSTTNRRSNIDSDDPMSENSVPNVNSYNRNESKCKVIVIETPSFDCQVCGSPFTDLEELDAHR